MVKTKTEAPQQPEIRDELAHWKQRAEEAEAKLAKLAQTEHVAESHGELLMWVPAWRNRNFPGNMKLYPEAVFAKENEDGTAD